MILAVEQLDIYRDGELELKYLNLRIRGLMEEE